MISAFKLIAMLVFFSATALFSTRYAFAPDATLSSPAIAKTVGTANPRAARMVCIVAAILCWIAVVASLIALIGALSDTNTH